MNTVLPLRRVQAGLQRNGQISLSPPATSPPCAPAFEADDGGNDDEEEPKALKEPLVSESRASRL